MSESRVIKRYANRKLYDTQSSHYVTLDQIAEMIRGGEEVRVLDNTTKEDLTSVTLAQIIFEEEKRQKSFLPLTAMRHIIQSGGASITELAQQAQARVTSLFRKGDEEEEAPPEAPPPPVVEAEGNQGAVREFLERTISPFAATEKEVARLKERVDELERELRALKGH